MDMPTNHFKRAILSGQTPYGVWLVSGAPATAEALGSAGFDFLVVDTEHTPIDPPQVADILRTMAGTPASAVVRPAWNDMLLIKRLLDTGVQTLLIPFVQNAEEAKRAVAYTRYPPDGVRGVSVSSRANQYGRIKDYFQRVHEELCVLVQIETRLALQNLEAIAGVNGVDALFIGPADLSADFGHLGEPRHPEMKAIIEDAIRRIRQTGKPAGILAPVEADARHWLSLGCVVVAVGSDLNLLARHSEELAARFEAVSKG